MSRLLLQSYLVAVKNDSIIFKLYLPKKMLCQTAQLHTFYPSTGCYSPYTVIYRVLQYHYSHILRVIVPIQSSRGCPGPNIVIQGVLIVPIQSIVGSYSPNIAIYRELQSQHSHLGGVNSPNIVIYRELQSQYSHLQCVMVPLQVKEQQNGRSRRPRDIRRRSEAARLLGLWVRIPSETWMSVSCECCVLSGRGLCDGLNTRPEESYRLQCVCV